MSERSLAQEWNAQAGGWARWTRTPGHDRHYPYNLRSFLGVVPPPKESTLDRPCFEAGPRIEEMREPRPTAEDVGAAPELANRRPTAEDVGAAPELAKSSANPAFLHGRCCR